ncbi:MAG: polymer-forming cytoskeletal protein [Bacteroidales bacterium]|nr:polymer-forming cytoskeletal protein [Bacteroidales bacterium]MCF8404945.1 polymer-forming cytoskeletal protein [Bacteroidales bacterium]
MAKNNYIEAKPNSIVAGTTIKGEISANGDFRIDGQLTGSIKCKGKIVVGQSGSIEGEIECQNADISGSIKAKVIVEQLLSLKATSKVHGDVITNKLSIEPGAVFSGTCDMDGSRANNPASNNKKIEQRQEEKVLG